MQSKGSSLKIGIFIVGIITGILFTRFGGGFFTSQSKLPQTKVSDGSEYSKRQPVSSDLTKLYPKVITRNGNPKNKTITLSFDDGPDLKYTPKILDILKKYNVKATFFVVGSQIEKYPTIFKRMIREGHDIANHGYRHLKITELTANQLKSQLELNTALMKKYKAAGRLVFRPPYGALDPTTIQTISKHGYKIALWTIDSRDWRSLNKSQVIKNVVSNFKNGYIVLQHCAAESKKENLSGSVQALPEIIKAARKQGFRLVTVSQLLESS